MNQRAALKKQNGPHGVFRAGRGMAGMIERVQGAMFLSLLSADTRMRL